MEPNGKVHEVDIVFNVSKFKFYLSLMVTIAVIMSTVFGFMMRINEMANDIEILKIQMTQFQEWAKTHQDTNDQFRENIIRRLDRIEYNQQKVFEKLGFKWYNQPERHSYDDE